MEGLRNFWRTETLTKKTVQLKNSTSTEICLCQQPHHIFLYSNVSYWFSILVTNDKCDITKGISLAIQHVQVLQPKGEKVSWGH